MAAAGALQQQQLFEGANAAKMGAVAAAAAAGSTDANAILDPALTPTTSSQANNKNRSKIVSDSKQSENVISKKSQVSLNVRAICNNNLYAIMTK